MLLKTVFSNKKKKKFNKVLSPIFKNWFTLSPDFHACSTRSSTLDGLVVPTHKIKLYERNPVNVSAIYT